MIGRGEDKNGLKEIACRGRNGWFKYNSHYTRVNHGYAYIGVNSKRYGNTAPIVISGDPEEIISLIESIIIDLKQEKAKEAWRDLINAIQHCYSHMNTKIIKNSKDLIDQTIRR